MPNPLVRHLPLVLTVFMMFPVGAGASETVVAEHDRASAAPKWVKDYPLWRAVPTKAFAVLGEGIVSNVRWGIYVYRDGPRSKPCIMEANLAFNGLYSSTQDCGGLVPPAPEPIYTLTTSESEWPNGKRLESSIIGLAGLSPEVTRVQVRIRPGPNLTVQSRLLSQRQAMKARVPQFRYVAKALNRKVCINQVIGLDQVGSEIFKTSPTDCRPSSGVVLSES